MVSRETVTICCFSVSRETAAYIDEPDVSRETSGAKLLMSPFHKPRGLCFASPVLLGSRILGLRVFRKTSSSR